MKLIIVLLIACCVWLPFFNCVSATAQEENQQEAAPNEVNQAAPNPKVEQLPNKELPKPREAIKRRAVNHQILLDKLPELKRQQAIVAKQSPPPAIDFFPQHQVQHPEAAKPALVKPLPAPLPARPTTASSFWQPLPGTLSPAARYQLNSLGPSVQLSPAMQWHLNRSRSGAQAPLPNSKPMVARAPGQNATGYYPGVSRIPPDKPFANLERPAGGLETYWPLLLEGRQDPNTGLIIWSLP